MTEPRLTEKAMSKPTSTIRPSPLLIDAAMRHSHPVQQLRDLGCPKLADALERRLVAGRKPEEGSKAQGELK